MTNWTLKPDGPDAAKNVFQTLETVFSLSGKQITHDRMSDVIYIQAEQAGYYVKRYTSAGIFRLNKPAIMSNDIPQRGKASAAGSVARDSTANGKTCNTSKNGVYLLRNWSPMAVKKPARFSNKERSLPQNFPTPKISQSLQKTMIRDSTIPGG